MPSKTRGGSVVKPRNRAQDIKPERIQRFGIRITQTDPTTKKAKAAVCRFCVAFGRDANRYTTIKYFQPPFRTDNFIRHLRDQHPERLGQYKDLDSVESRYYFFEVALPYAESIRSHFGRANSAIILKIGKGVMETLLPLFNEKDGFEQRMPHHVNKCDLSEDYVLTIRKGTLFKIVVYQIALGLRFRAVTLSLRALRPGGNCGFLDGLTEQQVSLFVQSLTILNFEALKNILSCRSVWCYSIATEVATNRESSYLDVRVRVVHEGMLRNFHIMAIPFNESHTGENMHAMRSRVLGVICGESWRQKLLAVTTDGASNMTGRHRGLVSLLERDCPYPLFRAWCGAHQLDLIVESCLSKDIHDAFYQPLTSLISYLRRQQRFSAEVNAKCPTVATTRCLSLGRVVRWIVKKRVEIMGYIERDDTASYEMPCSTWWLFLFAVEALMESADICFMEIQGKDTLVVEQTDLFAKLRTEIYNTFDITMLNGVDVLSATALGSLVYTLNGITATSEGMANFFENCGNFATACLHSLDSSETTALFNLWGTACVRFSDRLDKLCVERSSCNTPIACIPPPVMPGQIAELSVKGFMERVEMQRDRLMLSWTADHVEDIEDDLRRFHGAFRRGGIPQICLRNSFSGGSALKTAWDPILAKFRALAKFAFGLATIFPGTATVEADFSHLNREASADRSGLTGLSLQGILFARQWKEVRQLRVWDEVEE